MDRALLNPWLRPMLLPLKRWLDHVEWLLRGRTPPLPPPRKQAIILEHMQRWHATTLVETGTYLGETVAALRPHFEHVYSIELDPRLYQAAVSRFRRYAEVRILHGDSGQLVRSLVPELSGTVLFWLDGHYSGGMTALGEAVTPVEAELEAIFRADASLEPIVLIDDARLFTGEGGYPSIGALLQRTAELAPNYLPEVEGDIVALTPRPAGNV